VFISYAHDSEAHTNAVWQLYELLRSCGIDAQLDHIAAQRRQDWSLWMADEISRADHVLVVASLTCRERAQAESGPDVGRGVQWEARLIRDAFYRDQRALDRFLPVVLPGETVEGVPDFLAPAITTVYYVREFTVDGAEPLVRLLTDKPAHVEPPLGQRPVLGIRRPPLPGEAPARPDQRLPGVHNQITGNVTGQVIQAHTVGSISLGGAPPDPDAATEKGH
jgi:hypothetical protein